MIKIFLIILILIILITLILYIIFITLTPKICGHRCYFRENAFYKKGFLEPYKYNPEIPFEIIKIYNKNNNKKIISYSLYGTNNKYFKYLDQNIEDIKNKLPDWSTRIYVHDKVNPEVINKLIHLGVEIYIVKDYHVVPGNSAGAFWRFLPLCEDVDLIIFDIDEPVTKEKIKKINKFFNQNDYVISSGNSWVWQKNHMLAGLILKKREFKLPYGQELIKSYFHRSSFGADEIFLSQHVYPYAKKQGYIRNQRAKFLEFIYPLNRDFIRKIKLPCDLN